jgi:hypothetical protein
MTDPKHSSAPSYPEEFIDEMDHPALLGYLDEVNRMEDLGYDPNSLVRMREFIRKDPDLYDPYLVLSAILRIHKKNDEADAVITTAYERAVTRMMDKDGHWPKRMFWGFLHNRHILRIIEEYAHLLWDRGNAAEALEVFRKLLRMNPDDNQSIRFHILALRMGFNSDWPQLFQAGLPDHFKAMPLQQWFEKNAKSFPGEFDGVFE